MVNPVITPMIIAARIRRYVNRFENAGATDARGAKTLQSLGLDNGFLFNRLLANNVFIEASPGYFYVSRENFMKYRQKRRTRALYILTAIMVVLVISYLFL